MNPTASRTMAEDDTFAIQDVGTVMNDRYQKSMSLEFLAKRSPSTWWNCHNHIEPSLQKNILQPHENLSDTMNYDPGFDAPFYPSLRAEQGPLAIKTCADNITVDANTLSASTFGSLDAGLQLCTPQSASVAMADSLNGGQEHLAQLYQTITDRASEYPLPISGLYDPHQHELADFKKIQRQSITSQISRSAVTTSSKHLQIQRQSITFQISRSAVATSKHLQLD